MNTTNFAKLVQTRLGVSPDGAPGNLTLAALDNATYFARQGKV